MSMNDSKAGSVALEVGGISKRFGSFEALRDISFELRQGEFLTMLGPSGSGKTTTLRVIAGFLSPDSGFLKVHGRDVIGVPPNRRSIGMVFQDYALFPHMNVAQNVAFPLEARGIGRAESKRTVESMIGVGHGRQDHRPARENGRACAAGKRQEDPEPAFGADQAGRLSWRRVQDHRHARRYPGAGSMNEVLRRSRQSGHHAPD